MKAKAFLLIFTHQKLGTALLALQGAYCVPGNAVFVRVVELWSCALL